MTMINKTIGGIINENAKNFPDRQAIKYTVVPFERTWAELDRETDRLARGLMALGLKKGDHFAIWATNVPEWLLGLFAAVKIGLIVVTVNTNYKIFEMEYLMRQSDSKALLMIDGFKDSSYTSIMGELVPELKTQGSGNIKSEKFPHLQHVIFAGEKIPEGMIPFAKLYELADKVSEADFIAVNSTLTADEVINMQYTSGTTGFPKGVMLTHYNIVNNGNSIGDCMKFTEQDRLLITVPLFHCFGIVLGVMACITHATTMVVIPFFKTHEVLEALQSEHCTAMHGVPTMFIAVLDHPDFKKYKFNLRTGIMAGSPCPIKVMRQVVDEMGASDITIVYGQTEASPGCTQTTVDDTLAKRVETVGRVLPGIEAKITDPETGATLPPHKPGEFCAKGYNLMRGYYKMPEATSLAIDKDGWLHTGDLATVDDEGYYKIVGRIKDMIIRGGENIYPKEIEEFLYTHPAISDVQVVGLPSREYGEEVCAVIILKKGMTVSEEEVKEYVRSHLSRHKTPKYVRFVDAFPTTASGKIQKYKLREEGIEIYKLQDAARIETA